MLTYTSLSVMKITGEVRNLHVPFDLYADCVCVVGGGGIIDFYIL